MSNESFSAIRTIKLLHQPLVQALGMEQMLAAESFHPAGALDGLEADGTVLSAIFLYNKRWDFSDRF